MRANKNDLRTTVRQLRAEARDQLAAIRRDRARARALRLEPRDPPAFEPPPAPAPLQPLQADTPATEGWLDAVAPIEPASAESFAPEVPAEVVSIAAEAAVMETALDPVGPITMRAERKARMKMKITKAIAAPLKPAIVIEPEPPREMAMAPPPESPRLAEFPALGPALLQRLAARNINTLDDLQLATFPDQSGLMANLASLIDFEALARTLADQRDLVHAEISR